MVAADVLTSLPGVATALLALWVGGRRERRSRRLARDAALTRFRLEMRHNAVLQARGARMIDLLLAMGPQTLPAGLPPSLSTGALEALPADAFVQNAPWWHVPGRKPRPSGAPLYLASLRLQAADWNSAVRVWEVQPGHLAQDGVRAVLANAAFGAYMGLQQVADLLPELDATYVRTMSWMSDAVAECGMPIPTDWRDQPEVDAPTQRPA